MGQKKAHKLRTAQPRQLFNKYAGCECALPYLI